jgi:ADP-ribose pyrophosphatase YjhB (NUDIX family)
MIPAQQYKEILRVLPILCVDLIIVGPDGRYLLVKRRNEPLMGEWWTVGGRILHGEKALDAAQRKLREEVGLKNDVMEFVGFYEDWFDRNSFEAGGVYHTVSLIYKTVFRKRPAAPVLDAQSSDWMWAESLPEHFVTRIEPYDALNNMIRKQQ